MNNVTLSSWISDFILRIKQLAELKLQIEDNSLDENLKIWLGGLFNPETFITATRQQAARSNKWSLEDLVLEISKDDYAEKSNSFFIEKLVLHSADFKLPNFLKSTDEMQIQLSPLQMKWRRRETITYEEDSIVVPVYLNNGRDIMLFSVHVRITDNDPRSWYQRGTAFVCNKV